MESKRKPGFPRIEHQEEDAGLTHKSDRFNSWGSVQDRRTEASQEVMSNRRVAPLKGSKRHDTTSGNLFAPPPNPFANLNQNSNAPSFPSFNFGSSSTSAAPSFGSSTPPFQFGASQPSENNQNQSTQQPSFAFGQQQKPSTPPLFSFGQETSSTAPPMFTFGQNQPEKKSGFTFGEPASAQQNSSANQSKSSQPPIFSFGQPPNTTQEPSTASKQNGPIQNPFAFLSQQTANAQSSTNPSTTTSTSNLFNFNSSSPSTSTGTTSSSLFQHSTEPSNNIFASSSQVNSTPSPRNGSFDGPGQTFQSPGLFAQSQLSSSKSISNNIFGVAPTSPTKQAANPFNQATSHSENIQGSLFSNSTTKSNAINGASVVQANNDTVMTASPTKTANRSDDSDTVMTSPTKLNSSPDRTRETVSKFSSSLQDIKSNEETKQHPPFQAPKFASLSFDSGPFKNPFDNPSMTSTASSANASSPTTFKPQFSLDGSAFKVPAFVPPFTLDNKNDSSPEPRSEGDSTVETSTISKTPKPWTEQERSTSDTHSTEAPSTPTVHLPNESSAPNSNAEQRDNQNHPDHHLEDDHISSTKMELEVFNRAFVKALTMMDPLQDHSDMMRAYISQAEKITKAGQSTKRKAVDDFNVAVKKAKGPTDVNGPVPETPGKSKTSNLFASIIGKANSTPNDTGDNTSQSTAHATTLPTEKEVITSAPQDDADGISESSDSLFDDPKKSSAKSNPFAPRESQIPDAADDTESVASNGSTGKSLFERIDSTPKPTPPFQNPFSSEPDGATDQTWKVDSPIKFGLSYPNPSFLTPGPAIGSPGTSRATTPGTADGGMTSEAESAASNTGEANDGETNSESENTSHPQLDLTAEDPNQEILFETEKAKASVRDTAAKTWETRGIGPVRILKNSDTNSYTVLMRLSPSGKVLFHTSLVKGLSYTVQGSGAVIPVASEGNKFDTWYIKFKTKDLAETFADKCEELKTG